MIYRQLGQTGLEVSIISFGGGPLGSEYGAIDTQTGIRAVHAAIDRGVNFIDTSPYYGRTLSETRLGQALIGKRDKVILATKGGRYDFALFDFSADRLRRSVEESLTRLQTDVIDLYQLHDIEFVPTQQIIEESLPTLYQLRDEGKIRFIGITDYPLRLLQQVAEQREVDTILSYCHYNLMNTMLAQELMPFTRERGIGLINASPLHMGVLSVGGAQAWHPAPQSVHDKGQEAAAFVRERGGDITTLALQFVLQNPDIDTTLVGMRTEEEVEQNLSVIGTEPDAELLTAVQELIAPVKDINWQSGLPENHEPHAVPQRGH
jgi:L-galactose dehydrogenase